MTTQLSPNPSDLTHFLNEEIQKQPLKSSMNRKESPIKVETLYKEQKKKEHEELKRKENLERMRAKSELRQTYLPFSRNEAFGKRRSSLLVNNRKDSNQNANEAHNHLLDGGHFLTRKVSDGH